MTDEVISIDSSSTFEEKTGGPAEQPDFMADAPYLGTWIMKDKGIYFDEFLKSMNVGIVMRMATKLLKPTLVLEKMIFEKYDFVALFSTYIYAILNQIDFMSKFLL